MVRWMFDLKFSMFERVLALRPMYGYGKVLGFYIKDDVDSLYVVEMEGGLIQFVKEEDLKPAKVMPKLVSSKF